MAGLVWQATVEASCALGETGAFPPNVQQQPLADDPDAVESVFVQIRDGLQTCMEQGQGTKEDFETAVGNLMAVPAAVDESFGYPTVVGVPDGERWDIRLIFLRKGATLMWFQELEVVERDGDNEFTVNDVGEMADRPPVRAAEIGTT